MQKTLIAFAGALVVGASLFAADQPQWGQPNSFNMVSNEKNLVDDFDPGQKIQDTGCIDPATTRNVKWTARLGNESFGTPVIAGGKIFVGTNNDAPRDARISGDRGVLMCFEEKTGKFLWELNLPKLERIKWADWKYIGITSPPVVDGNRAYLITNRAEVMCLDVEGMANGNDGPFVDEGKLMAGDEAAPLTPGPNDADIIWRFDMPREVLAEPHNAASGSVLSVGDYLYVCTANGVEWTHDHVVHPEAPSVIVLDKKTGKLVAKDNFGIGPDITHGQWSSPSTAQVGGRPVGFYGAGNGVLYAFELLGASARPQGHDPLALKTVWKFQGHPLAQTQDRVPPDHQHDSKTYEVTGIPVVLNNRIYAIFTQEPFHKMKQGWLVCLKTDGAGDVTRSGMVWSYDKLGSSSSTVAVADGLVYAPGFDGKLHCLDAETGKVYWVHDTGGPVWASPLVADGKIYLGNDKSMLWILQAGKELKVLNKIRMTDKVQCTPVAANGVLYITTYKNLYAIGK